MERLTTNKPVEEMSMTELAHNSCYAKDRKARYRDYEMDIDARDFARKLMLEFGEWKHIEEYGLDADNELVDDDIFDDTMLDNLQYEPTTTIGLIALFYRNLWAMADLHTRLKEYEEAEEQGLLLRLPCRVGDTIYRINQYAKEPIISMKVLQIHYGELSRGNTFFRVDAINDEDMGESCYFKDDFGKKVFLTKKEAEQALERMEGKNE